MGFAQRKPLGRERGREREKKLVFQTNTRGVLGWNQEPNVGFGSLLSLARCAGWRGRTDTGSKAEGGAGQRHLVLQEKCEVALSFHSRNS